MRFTYTFLVLLLCASLFAQEKPKKNIIQFTGVIFNQDSSSVVPGTHIYIPKSGRGTTTNPYGFFSMPVVEGDSIVFSSVGFKRSYYVVPVHKEESSLRIVVSLEEDISFLEEVEIGPYPSESIFKEAIITMELPHQKEYANIYQWLKSDYFKEAYYSLPASPNANAQYVLNQQRQAYLNKFSSPGISLLNPFAWSQFIQSLKKN